MLFEIPFEVLKFRTVVMCAKWIQMSYVPGFAEVVSFYRQVHVEHVLQFGRVLCRVWNTSTSCVSPRPFKSPVQSCLDCQDNNVYILFTILHTVIVMYTMTVNYTYVECIWYARERQDEYKTQA